MDNACSIPILQCSNNVNKATKESANVLLAKNKKLSDLPFGNFSFGGIMFVFISTALISRDSKKSPCEFENSELRQENFLAKTLHNLAGNVFILVRGPALMTEESILKMIINSHREKIIAIICTPDC